MKKYLMLAAAGMLASGVASAGLVDLTDNTFGSVSYDGAGPINAFTENVDGVLFSFSTAGQFRAVGTWSNGTTGSAGPWALSFGGGGGHTTAFDLTVDSDIQLDSFLGLNASFLVGPVFDVSGGSVSSLGNAFSLASNLSNPPVTESFVGGPLQLSAGQTYSFTTTNPGVTTIGHLFGLNFTVLDAGGQGDVPVPAVSWLLLSGLLGAGALRRLRRR